MSRRLALNNEVHSSQEQQHYRVLSNTTHRHEHTTQTRTDLSVPINYKSNVHEKKKKHFFTCLYSLLQINLEPKHCYSVSVVAPCTLQSNRLYGCHRARSSVDLWLFESVGPCAQLGPNEVLFTQPCLRAWCWDWVLVNCFQFLKACERTKAQR